MGSTWTGFSPRGKVERGGVPFGGVEEEREGVSSGGGEDEKGGTLSDRVEGRGDTLVEERRGVLFGRGFSSSSSSSYYSLDHCILLT